MLEPVGPGDGCGDGRSAGDIRVNHGATNGYGLVRPVFFTARDGATISGHIWATVSGPAKRPGIVITDGSAQADENMYWYAAETLAKQGYVVLTFDPQGQGQSDTLGAAPDTLEGVPAQTDGRPFYDGTEDAINFLLSSPSRPYEPVPSCSTGTSHAAKQKVRVRAGLDAPSNPYRQLLDRTAIGLAGHSYGAAGVSYIAQWNPRVKAVVAWDNLGGPGPKAAVVPGTAGGSATIGEVGCPADPGAAPPSRSRNRRSESRRTTAYRRFRTSSFGTRAASRTNRSPTPEPESTRARSSSAEARTWTSAGEVTRRRRRSTWATTAMRSRFYYVSRLHIHLRHGKPFDCEDLRDGCPGMVSADGFRATIPIWPSTQAPTA